MTDAQYSRGMSSEFVSPVSILIATLNAQATLERALASVRRYGQGAELIVVDGRSADSTMAILDRHQDIVTRIVSEPDRGIYDALNKGLGLATRRWVFVMGADDELLEGFARAVDDLHDAKTFYYGRIWLRQQGRPSSGGPYDDRRFLRSWPNHQALLAPTDVLRAAGGFDTRYRLAADWVMHMRLWRGGRNWQYVHHIFCNFNEEGEGARTGPDKRFRKRKLWLGLKYLSWQAVVCHLTEESMSKIGDMLARRLSRA